VDHHDETGKPCTRHGVIPIPRLLELAMVGSRAPGFHHDVASKLQSLVMAIDEIGELSGTGNPDLRLAVDTAATALREAQQLFGQNRSLAKPPQKTRVALSELVARASERAAVQVRGEIPKCDLMIALPAHVQALALVLDVAAGPNHMNRVVQATTDANEERVQLTLVGPAGAVAAGSALAAEALAIATFALSRDGGELRCGAAEQFTLVMQRSRVTMQIPKP
jgi:hypothetical protein